MYTPAVYGSQCNRIRLVRFFMVKQSSDNTAASVSGHFRKTEWMWGEIPVEFNFIPAVWVLLPLFEAFNAILKCCVADTFVSGWTTPSCVFDFSVVCLRTTLMVVRYDYYCSCLVVVSQKWDCRGLSMDFPWTFHGLSMDLSHANVHLSGSNSRRFLLDLGSR